MHCMTRSQIAHAPCAVQIHYNGDNTRLRIDFDVVGIYGPAYIYIYLVLALDEQLVRLQ